MDVRCLATCCFRRKRRQLAKTNKLFIFCESLCFTCEWQTSLHSFEPCGLFQITMQSPSQGVRVPIRFDLCRPKLSPPTSHGSSLPETTADFERAMRRQNVELAADRVLRRETRENRARLIQQFESWLWHEHSVAWDTVVAGKRPNPEEICKWLVAYGRDLHAAGKSYTKYAETINATGKYRPVIKSHGW